MNVSSQWFSSRIIRVFIGLLGIFVLQVSILPAAWDSIVFEDQFNYLGLPDQSKWLINHPSHWWWQQGQTHFPDPTTPGAHLPWVDGEALHIEHYQFNALDSGTPRTTFQGGEVRSSGPAGTLTPDQNYRIEARIRNDLYPDGLVSSFFLYGYDGTNSDEIDFEFVSRQTNDDSRWLAAGGNPLITNSWDESFQKPEWLQVSDLSLNDDAEEGWDTFVIYWYPASQRVEWRWLDPGNGETLLRTETDAAFVPDQAMNVFFNFWAPPTNAVWDGEPVGDPALLPDHVDLGILSTYEIDYVKVAASPFSDFNLDGDVDDVDLSIWEAAVGITDAADADGDDDSDGSDFLIWQRQFTGSLSLPGSTQVVPEPASIFLVLSGLLATSLRLRHPQIYTSWKH